MQASENTQKLQAIKLFVFEIARGDTVEAQYFINLLPETYALDIPGRITVTQTRGGWWVDNFGLGVGTLSMSGTTGFSLRPNANKGRDNPADQVDGYERWKGLVSFFNEFFTRQLASPNNRIFMRFKNYADEDYFLCVPMGLPKLQRSVQQSLLYRYQIDLQILERLNKLGYAFNETDILTEINSQIKRAAAIGARLEDKLDTQWEVLLKEILNQTAISATGEAFIEEMGVDTATRDKQTQGFVDVVRARNSSNQSVLPTDSSLGVASRTRKLGERIADFARGQTAFIETTLTEVRAVALEWREVLEALDYATHIPAAYAREVRETLCGVQALLLYPQLFRSTVIGAVEELNALFEESGCSTTLAV